MREETDVGNWLTATCRRGRRRCRKLVTPMDSLRGPSLLVNLSGSLPLSPQFCEWALREKHLAIPSPAAGCFHCQPEGMRGGDSDRNARVGPLKAAERRWDPSGGSRRLLAQICSLPPSLCPGSLWQNSTRAGTLGAPQQ